MENIILIQNGMVLFFGSFFIEFEHVILFLLLLIAALVDLQSRRIPNKLVLFGALAAISFQTVSPYGIGFSRSIGGLAVGLIAFLPLYIARSMGAGDVKLIAMIGAFLGPASTIGAILTILVAGGALAIASSIKNKSTLRMLNNLRIMMAFALVGATTGNRIDTKISIVSAGTLPYGVAIAAGTTVHLLLEKYGHALFS